jgi:sialidase-1
MYDWKVLATGPGHGIQLKTVRLLVPIWLSTGEKGHRPSITSTLYSDDHGKTWRCGDVAVPNVEPYVNPNETAAVELSDGTVMLNVRSESKPNRRLIVTSHDGATHWSTPRFDDALWEPICFGSLLRVSGKPPSDRSRILFANARNLSRADRKNVPGQSRERKNLSIHLSYDEAQTWPIIKTLEEGPSGYCDLAMLADGTILCFYERATPGSRNIFDTGALTLARFNLQWLTDDKDRLPTR